MGHTPTLPDDIKWFGYMFWISHTNLQHQEHSCFISQMRRATIQNVDLDTKITPLAELN